MISYYSKGGLEPPRGELVPRASYTALLGLHEVTILAIVPAFCSGYLIIGLLILRHADQVKKAGC
jgi:hypothetical protein